MYAILIAGLMAPAGRFTERLIKITVAYDDHQFSIFFFSKLHEVFLYRLSI